MLALFLPLICLLTSYKAKTVPNIRLNRKMQARLCQRPATIDWVTIFVTFAMTEVSVFVGNSPVKIRVMIFCKPMWLMADVGRVYDDISMPFQ